MYVSGLQPLSHNAGYIPSSHTKPLPQSLYQAALSDLTASQEALKSFKKRKFFLQSYAAIRLTLNLSGLFMSLSFGLASSKNQEKLIGTVAGLALYILLGLVNFCHWVQFTPYDMQRFFTSIILGPCFAIDEIFHQIPCHELQLEQEVLNTATHLSICRKDDQTALSHTPSTIDSQIQLGFIAENV